MLSPTRTLAAVALATATLAACSTQPASPTSLAYPGTPGSGARATEAGAAGRALGSGGRAVPLAAAGTAAQADPTPTPTTTATPTGKPKLDIADITPMGSNKEKVGIGFPIIVTFDRDVQDRAAALAVLQVESEHPVDGAWRWITPRKVVYRTKTYWRPHQEVVFTARLSQIPGNSAKDQKRTFAVGNANIINVNTRTHLAKITRDGKLKKKIPISAGRGGMVKNGVDLYLTTSGTHLAMGKKPVEIMTSAWMGVTDPKDPRYYKEKIPWAVRISDSGEYFHQSAGYYQYLGHSNQSHGCVRATPAGAKWYYGISQRGDVVKITGTKRKLDWRNGWGFWQLTWTQWKSGKSI